MLAPLALLAALAPLSPLPVVVGHGTLPIPGCGDAQLLVELAYLPGNQGVVAFHHVAPPGGCLLHSGGSAAVGTLAYDTGAVPPAAWRFACHGNPWEGLDCGPVQVGPTAHGGDVRFRAGDLEGTFRVLVG